MATAELAAFALERPGQAFALISFVSPHSAQKTDVHGFRLYGAFATLDDARAYARVVNDADPTFDVYVVEMYKWCAWHPDPALIADTVYTDRKLTELVAEHKKAQSSAREAFEARLVAAPAPAPRAP